MARKGPIRSIRSGWGVASLWVGHTGQGVSRLQPPLVPAEGQRPAAAVRVGPADRLEPAACNQRGERGPGGGQTAAVGLVSLVRRSVCLLCVGGPSCPTRRKDPSCRTSNLPRHCECVAEYTSVVDGLSSTAAAAPSLPPAAAAAVAASLAAALSCSCLALSARSLSAKDSSV